MNYCLISQIIIHYLQRLVLATVPFSDRFYYGGSKETRKRPVRFRFLPNGSLNLLHQYWSENLVFGMSNMQFHTVHLLVVSDFAYLNNSASGFE